MCEKVKNKKTSNTRIDWCMKPLIKFLQSRNWLTVACCCGHNKYPMTVVVRMPHLDNRLYELFSEIPIPRTRNFYKRDAQGYYYIPEVCGEK